MSIVMISLLSPLSKILSHHIIVPGIFWDLNEENLLDSSVLYNKAMISTQDWLSQGPPPMETVILFNENLANIHYALQLCGIISEYIL